MKRRPDPDNDLDADPDNDLDDEIADLLNQTIDTLILLRGSHHDTNAGNEIDAVATLISLARCRLPDLVADARDQANTWTQIANQLGITRPHAIARYALHAHTRRPPLEID